MSSVYAWRELCKFAEYSESFHQNAGSRRQKKTHEIFTDLSRLRMGDHLKCFGVRQLQEEPRPVLNATWREAESNMGSADKSIATGKETVVIVVRCYIQDELWVSLAYYF